MIKIVKLSILIFISFIVITSDIYALSVCEMSDEYEKWLNLSPSEKEEFIEPPYCASTYKNQYTAEKKLESEESLGGRYLSDEELRASISQSTYNAVDVGVVTSVKNQGNTNTCWAFTTNSLLETASIIEGVGTLDLSERHIEYAMTKDGFSDGSKKDGLYRVLDEGGNSFYSSAYYFRHEGPILEKTMPFVNNSQKISISSMPNASAVLDVDTYTFDYFSNYSSCTTNQINAIKERIIKYGSAGASMYYSDDYLFSNKYYFYSGNLAANHAVVIVGWDDTVPGSSFKHTPNGSGAWIVKNSWGSSFGNNGYIYISYSDTKICGNSYHYSGVRVNEYNNTYASSEFMSSYSLNLGGNTTYLSSKFTKKSSKNEYLDKVSIEVVTGNTYEVYISLSNTIANANDWKLLGKGKATSDGIVSVKFDPITITKDFTIITKVSGSGYYVPMMCASTSKSSKFYNAEITSGKNFASTDGRLWTDVALVADGAAVVGCEPVIYAYTKHAKSGTASFNIDSIKESTTYVFPNSDDYYKVNISTNNILSYELFDLYIFNSSGANVTNKFTIANNISNGNVIIRMNANITPGVYTFRLKYSSTMKEVKFTVYNLLSSSSYEIRDSYIIANLGTQKELTKSKFFNNIKINSSNYRLLDQNKANVTNSASKISTGMYLQVNNRNIAIVVLGDVSGDGKVMSNDALLVSRYIVKIKSLTGANLLAADTSRDGKVLSNDALLISRFLVGLRTSL